MRSSTHCSTPDSPFFFLLHCIRLDRGGCGLHMEQLMRPSKWDDKPVYRPPLLVIGFMLLPWLVLIYVLFN